MYKIIAPNGKEHFPPEGRCWTTIESEYLKAFADNRVTFGSDGNGVPRRKQYLAEAKGLVPWSWWPFEEVGHTDEAKKEIKAVLGDITAFDTPKPVRLINAYLFEGYSQAEIAKNLGISHQAVAKKLKQLKTFLKNF